MLPSIHDDHMLDPAPSETYSTDPGYINSMDLLPLVKEEVFAQLFDEAVHDTLSSEGELSDIANSERDRMTKVSVPTVVKSEPPTSCLLTDWPGEHQFDISLPAHTKPKDPQYSSLVNKLYICQNSSVTIQLTYSVTSPVPSFSLKATMVFTSPDHSQQPVTVCFQHSQATEDPLSTHLMRVTSDLVQSKYLQFKNTGKHVVVLDPLPCPEDNDKFVPIHVRFTDLGSCIGGINRRDTAVVFTLERGGLAVGRKVLPVRVCTCPKRDRELDEKGREGGSKQKDEGSSRDRTEDDKTYWVPATGRENYEALRKVGEILEKGRGGDVVKWGNQVKLANKRRKLDN